jgi:hypothetical protein
MKVNILTKGFRSPNASSWLSPLVTNKHKLIDAGVNINFFLKDCREVKDCDVVIVESKFVRDDWSKNKHKIFELITDLKTEHNKVFFYDLGDSTFSWVLEVLPYVDKLLKTFVFKDKTNYCRPLNGCNLWTDYYFKNGSIKGDTIRVPVFLQSKDKHLLDKIHVGYNATFANHSLNSHLWKFDYLHKLSRRSFKLCEKMLNHTVENDFTEPRNKLIDVSCRMSLNGYSGGVEFHRQKTAKILKKYLSTSKLNRGAYFSEITKSKIVVSPFGWGEINTPRDYEVALSGAILLKPDISHIETWPNIFNEDTVVQYQWDLSDLKSKVHDITMHYDDYVQYAINLQKQYKDCVLGEIGQNKFCEYFITMIRE